jgi:hypothetical protein
MVAATLGRPTGAALGDGALIFIHPTLLSQPVQTPVRRVSTSPLVRLSAPSLPTAVARNALVHLLRLRLRLRLDLLLYSMASITTSPCRGPGTALLPPSPSPSPAFDVPLEPKDPQLGPLAP